MSRDRSVASRAFEFCLLSLLAAMALYGAVQLIKAVWLTISIGAGVVFITAGIALHIRRSYQRW